MGNLLMSTNQLPAIMSTIAANQKAFISNFNIQPIIHYWDQSSITIYSPNTKRRLTLSFDQKIDRYADSIAHGTKIFIMGGDLIADVYEFDIPTKILHAKNPMKVKKYHHSLCNNGKDIYSIGGFAITKALDDCEKYDVIKNNWATLPKLNSPRWGCALFIFSKRYMYSFEGYDFNFLNSMVRLNLLEMRKWETVTVAHPPSARTNIHGIQINEKQVLAFGGYTGSRYMNDSYLLNMLDTTVECVRADDMAGAGSFSCSTSPVIVNGAVYGVDYYKNIHKYKTGKWELLIS